MDDHDRLDAAIGPQAPLDVVGIDTVPPVAGHEGDVQAEALCHGLPQGGELPRLIHQHVVAGGEGVDDRRLPRAGAGGGKDHDGAGCLEHCLTSGKDRAA